MSKQANPEGLIKVYRFLEKFWLIVACVALALSMYIMIADGFQAARFYLFLPAIAFTIWFMRRRLRISHERMHARNQKENKA